MPPSTTTIELPRQPDESARAFEARQAYVLMGADRSTAKVAQALGKSKTLMDRWSARFGWSETAEKYDAEVNYVTVQDAADQYRQDLEAHRKRAMDAAKNLHALANGLTRIYADALQQPSTIKGADGKTYTLHKLKVGTETLTTIGRAIIGALDLEAHGLGVASVLARLDGDDEAR